MLFGYSSTFVHLLFLAMPSHSSSREDNSADAISAESPHSKNNSDGNSDSTISSPDETTPLEASSTRRSQGAIPKSRRNENSSKEKSNSFVNMINFLFVFHCNSMNYQ